MRGLAQRAGADPETCRAVFRSAGPRPTERPLERPGTETHWDWHCGGRCHLRRPRHPPGRSTLGKDQGSSLEQPQPWSRFAGELPGAHADIAKTRFLDHSNQHAGANGPTTTLLWAGSRSHRPFGGRDGNAVSCRETVSHAIENGLDPGPCCWVGLTLAITCKARLNDRSRSDRTFAPCLVHCVVVQHGATYSRRATTMPRLLP